MAEIVNKFLNETGLSQYTAKVKGYVNDKVKEVSDANASLGEVVDDLSTALSALDSSVVAHFGTVDTKFADVDSSITSVKSDLAALKEDVGDWSDTTNSIVDVLNAHVNNSTTKWAELDSSIGDVSTRVKTVEDKVTALETWEAVVDSSIDALETWKGETTTKLTGLDTSVSAIEDTLTDVSTRLKGHDTSISKIEAAVFGEGEGDEKSLPEQIADNKTAIEKNATDIAANKTAIDKLNGDADTEGSVAKAVKDAKDALESALDDAVADVTESVEAVDGKVDDLTVRVKANEDAIAVLKGDDKTEGSVAYAVSAGVTQAVTTVLDGAGEAFDTLKEVEKWIGNHGSEAAELTSSITALEGVVGKAASTDEEGNDVPATGLVAAVAKNAADIETNAAAIEDNADAIEVLNGDADTEGSVAKAVKDAVDPVSAKVTALEETVNGKGEGEEHVKGLVENLGDVTDRVSAIETSLNDETDGIAAKLDSVASDLDDFKTDVADTYATKDELKTVSDDLDALEEVVGKKAVGEDAATGVFADIAALDTRVTALEDVKWEAITEGEINALFAE